MGVVSQIIDLDNSSKALPYKSAVTSFVGEGLAPPENHSVQRHLPRSRSNVLPHVVGHACPTTVPAETYIFSTNIVFCSHALPRVVEGADPYKFTATSTVGDGASTSRTYPLNLTQPRSISTPYGGAS